MAYNYQGGPMSMGMGGGGGGGMMYPGGQMMAGGMMMHGMMPGFPQMPGMMGGGNTGDTQQHLPGLNDAPLEFNTSKGKPPMPISGHEMGEDRGGGGGMVGGVAPPLPPDYHHGGGGGGWQGHGLETGGGGSHSGGRGGGGGGSSAYTKDTATGGGGSSGKRERGGQRRGGSRFQEEKGNNESRSSRNDRNNKDHLNESKDMGSEMEGLETNGEMQPALWGMPGMGPPMPYPVMGMPMMDPNMMMSQYGMVPTGMEGGMGVAGQEVIELKSVTLVPPQPGVQLPSTRERPPGCKTVFVGGLAENTTEEIIREIFIRCGDMQTVRLSKKKFCHIRFFLESSVDAALFYSGYRMRIENKTDAPNTGRLHVDFAQARDDQFEWECKQRQLQREARHREKVEKDRMRVPSPPPVPHFTEHEAASVAEKIKAEDSFGKAVQVVITWLERGDCNKRNASAFYSMIQSTNSHIRRLLSEKAAHEEELLKAKELMKARMQGLLLQYTQVEQVFIAASHKKVWDHFTKAQRKNIEMWKKQAAEIKSVELEEHLNTEEEMDLSDDEESSARKKFKADEKYDKLKEENDSLRCQLEAYKNEVDLVKSELKVELDKSQSQLRLTQQTLQGMQAQLVEAKTKVSMKDAKVAELEAKIAQLKKSSDSASNAAESEVLSPSLPSPLTEDEAKLIGLISLFLHVHPFGAGLDYVWSYLQKVNPAITPSEVESLMVRFPAIFQQELSGIGANMERKWIITAFKPKEKDLGITQPSSTSFVEET